MLIVDPTVSGLIFRISSNGDSELDPQKISVSWSSVSLILKCTYETPLSPVDLLTRSPSPIFMIIFSRTSMPSSTSDSGIKAP